MNLWRKLFNLSGWKFRLDVPQRDKCVICVAPHTSNWDFMVGIFAYKSLGREANFLMKSFWFFFPLKYILNALGGIPVRRKGKKGSLTESVIEMFATRPYVNLAVTPEGTRSRTERWHTGFLYIAYGAKVPIQLAVIDYRTKTAFIEKEFNPTGDAEKDLASIRQYYARYGQCARYPEKFQS